jgi:hypothetical protein
VITKTYKGNRDKTGCSVTVNGKPLALAESPEEDDDFPEARQFAWGDDSEASQYLAYCILHDFAPNDASYRQICHAFHEDFIKQIRDDEWQLTNEELEEGIRFWKDVMRIAPPIVAGEPMRRLTIPAFIWRVFIKRAKFPGGTVKPEQVDEALKKLGEMRGDPAESRSIVAETPADYAPTLRPEK